MATGLSSYWNEWSLGAFIKIVSNNKSNKKRYFPTSEKDVTEEVFSYSGKSVSKGGL